MPPLDAPFHPFHPPRSAPHAEAISAGLDMEEALVDPELPTIVTSVQVRVYLYMCFKCGCHQGAHHRHLCTGACMVLWLCAFDSNVGASNAPTIITSSQVRPPRSHAH